MMTEERALPTGTISMNDVRNELKVTGTISLNDSAVRKLAGKTSGQIAMSDLRGKSNIIDYLVWFQQLPKPDNYIFSYQQGKYGSISTNTILGHSGTITRITLGRSGSDCSIALYTSPSKITNKVKVTYNGQVGHLSHTAGGVNNYFGKSSSGIFKDLYYAVANNPNGKYTINLEFYN